MLSHEEGAEGDMVLRHFVVEQDPDGHDRSRTRGHCGVHEEDVVVLDVLWQSQVIELEK